MKHLYKLRDELVHPSGKLSAPEIHPELEVAVDRRFVKYRAVAAEEAVVNSIAALRKLTGSDSVADGTLFGYLKALHKRLLILEQHPDAVI